MNLVAARSVIVYTVNFIDLPRYDTGCILVIVHKFYIWNYIEVCYVACARIFQHHDFGKHT